MNVTEGGPSSSGSAGQTPVFDQDGFQVIVETASDGSASSRKPHGPPPPPDFSNSGKNPYREPNCPILMVKVRLDGPSTEEEVQPAFGEFKKALGISGAQGAETKRRTYGALWDVTKSVMTFGVLDISYNMLRGAARGFSPTDQTLLFPGDFGLPEDRLHSAQTAIAGCEKDSRSARETQQAEEKKTSSAPVDVLPSAQLEDILLFGKFSNCSKADLKNGARLIPDMGEHYGARSHEDLSRVLAPGTEPRIVIGKLEILNTNTNDALYAEEIAHLLEAFLEGEQLIQSGKPFIWQTSVKTRQFWRRRAAFILLSKLGEEGFLFCISATFIRLNIFAMAVSEMHYRHAFELGKRPLSTIVAGGLVPRDAVRNSISVVAPLLSTRLGMFETEQKVWKHIEEHIQTIDEKLAGMQIVESAGVTDVEKKTGSDSDGGDKESEASDGNSGEVSGGEAEEVVTGIPVGVVQQTFSTLLDVEKKGHWRVTASGNPMSIDAKTGATAVTVFLSCTQGSLFSDAICIQHRRRKKSGSAAKLLPKIAELRALAKLLCGLGAQGNTVSLVGFSQGGAILYRLLRGDLLQGCNLGHIRILAPYWVMGENLPNSRTYLENMTDDDIKTANRAFEFPLPDATKLAFECESIALANCEGDDWHKHSLACANMLFRASGGYSDSRVVLITEQGFAHQNMLFKIYPDRDLQTNDKALYEILYGDEWYNKLEEKRQREKTIFPLENVAALMPKVKPDAWVRLPNELPGETPLNGSSDKTSTSSASAAPKERLLPEATKTKSATTAPSCEEIGGSEIENVTSPKSSAGTPEKTSSKVQDEALKFELMNTKGCLRGIYGSLGKKSSYEILTTAKGDAYPCESIMDPTLVFCSDLEDSRLAAQLLDEMWTKRPMNVVETMNGFYRRLMAAVSRVLGDMRVSNRTQYFRIVGTCMIRFGALSQLLLLKAIQNLDAKSIAHIGIEREWAFAGYDSHNAAGGPYRNGVYLNLFLVAQTTDVLQFADSFRAADQSDIQIALPYARCGTRLRLDHFWPVSTRLRSGLYKHLKKATPNPYLCSNGNPMPQLPENPNQDKKPKEEKSKYLKRKAWYESKDAWKNDWKAIGDKRSADGNRRNGARDKQQEERDEELDAATEEHEAWEGFDDGWYWKDGDWWNSSYEGGLRDTFSEVPHVRSSSKESDNSHASARTSSGGFRPATSATGKHATKKPSNGSKPNPAQLRSVSRPRTDDENRKLGEITKWAQDQTKVVGNRGDPGKSLARIRAEQDRSNKSRPRKQVPSMKTIPEEDSQDEHSRDPVAPASADDPTCNAAVDGFTHDPAPPAEDMGGDMKSEEMSEKGDSNDSFGEVQTTDALGECPKIRSSVIFLAGTDETHGGAHEPCGVESEQIESMYADPRKSISEDSVIGAANSEVPAYGQGPSEQAVGLPFIRPRVHDEEPDFEVSNITAPGVQEKPEEPIENNASSAFQRDLYGEENFNPSPEQGDSGAVEKKRAELNSVARPKQKLTKFLKDDSPVKEPPRPVARAKHLPASMKGSAKFRNRPGQMKHALPRRPAFRSVDQFLDSGASIDEARKSHAQELTEAMIPYLEPVSERVGEWPDFAEKFLAKYEHHDLALSARKLVKEGVSVHYHSSGLQLDNLKVDDATDRPLGAVCLADLREKHRMLTNAVVGRTNLERAEEDQVRYAQKVFAQRSPKRRSCAIIASQASKVRCTVNAVTGERSKVRPVPVGGRDVPPKRIPRKMSIKEQLERSLAGEATSPQNMEVSHTPERISSSKKKGYGAKPKLTLVPRTATFREALERSLAHETSSPSARMPDPGPPSLPVQAVDMGIQNRLNCIAERLKDERPDDNQKEIYTRAMQIHAKELSSGSPSKTSRP